MDKMSHSDGKKRDGEQCCREAAGRGNNSTISTFGSRRSKRWVNSSASPRRSTPISKTATITYLVGSRKDRRCCSRTSKATPAAGALYNMIGCNLSRFCLMIGQSGWSTRSRRCNCSSAKWDARWRQWKCRRQTRSRTKTSLSARRSTSRELPAMRLWPLERRQILRDRRRGGHQMPPIPGGATFGTYHDDQGSSRGRRLPHREGNTIDQREILGKRRPDAHRRVLGIDPLLFLGSRHELARDGKRVRLLWRHQPPHTDRAVRQRPDRPAVTGAAPRSFSKAFSTPMRRSEETVRKFTGYPRPGDGTAPNMRIRKGALPR